MTRKYRSHQKPKQDPDIREVKYILLAVGLVMMFLIGTATLGQQAQPLRFLDGIIPLAYADNSIVMLGDLNQPSHAGTGTSCPAITGPSSATEASGNKLQHFRQGSSLGCKFSTWTLDKTTTTHKLLPTFYDDLITGLGFIYSQTEQSFFGNDCRLYEVSEQGVDPRLNITGAYEALRNRVQNVVGGLGQCDNGVARSDFRTSSILNWQDSIAINNTFFSFGINVVVDDRPVAQDPDVNGNSYTKFTFTNPTPLNNTVWMMQEHPKFPSSTLDGAFFGIDDTTFTMDSNTVDDTEVGQVVVFREFDKSDLGGWDTSGIDYVSGDNNGEMLQNTLSQDTIPADIFWKPDGLTVFALGQNNDLVYEYRLNNPEGVTGAQAWNSTSCFNNGSLVSKNSNPINSCRPSVTGADTFSIITDSPQATGLFFKPDGLKMYISDNTDKDIDEYTLSTAYDLSTASYTQSGSVTVFGVLEGFEMTNDGKRLYTSDGSSANITQYDLGTAWDISTISFNQFYDASVFSGDDGITSAQDVVLRPDGGRMFILDNDASGIVNHLETYDLSTPFDISTATWVEKAELSHGVANTLEAMDFKNDGTTLYILAFSNSRLYEWSLLASASSGVRITGGIVSQTSAADQWLRVEVKDGSYGTGTLDSFPENEYDIYQGGGSLGVIHLEPTTTITPFEINLRPNWADGLEDTATLFIGIDDNSTGGSTIVNITSIEWSNQIKYDFEDINVLEFYETSPVESFSVTLFDDIRPALNDYDMGILNITEVATGSISIPALPTPSAVTNIVLNLEHYDAIEVTWDHDILNTTGYRIERDDGTGFQTIVELDANTEQSFIDANQEDQARSKIRSLLNATGLDENTTYTYRVIAINGPAEITTTSSPLTTPDSLPYWDLIEHATSSSTTPNVDFATTGGDTNDWLEMIDLDAVASGDRSAVIMKSFNKTELGIGNFTDFQTFFDTQCNTGGASSDCPNALRIIISDGKFNRYSDTMFPTNLDIFAFDASIKISEWGGGGTAHHQGGGTTFDPNLVRISPDMDKVVADDDFVTVLFSIDLGDPDAGQVDVKNFTVTNSTTWDFTNSILNYTSNLGNCNIPFPDNELENSIDACDSGTIFATTSPHLELIQTYNATTDFQYREKKDNVNPQGFSRWTISVNSTGVVATDDDSATPNLPREVGDFHFFKTFTPTSASTSLKVSVTGQPNPDGSVSMSLAAWSGLLGDIDETGRWDNGDFETNTDIFAKLPLITSGAGCSTTGPQTCSVINEEVIVDTTSFIGVPISVGVFSQDLFGFRNAIFVIHNLTIAETFYDFTNAVLKEEVSGTTADRGLVSPSSIIISSVPNPPSQVNATASISNVIINWTSVQATPEVDTYWVERGLALNETWQFRQQQLDVSASFPPQCGWSDALDHLLLRGDSDVSNKKQTCYTVKTFPRDLLNGSQIQINYDYTTGIQPESVRVLVDVRDNLIEVNDDSEWNEATARNFGLTDVAEINETFLPKNTGLRTDDLIDFLSEWDEPDSEFATVIIELNDESIFSNGQRVELFWINVTDFTTGEPRAFYNFSDSPVVSFPETCSEGNDCSRGSIGSSTDSLAVVIGNTTASVNAVGKTIEEISSTADFFDDFSTDNGWESNFPSDYFIDTTAGTLNFSDASHLSPVAKISLNLESFVGDLDENLFSMRTKIVFESTDGNQSYLEMLGLSNQSSSFNQENCDATTSATQQLCLSQSPTFDDWQLFISNGTNTVTNNLSLTSAESFIPYYVELIKVGTDYTTTVYLNENFTNQFVSFKGTVNIDFTEFIYLTLGEARASSNTGTGITGYWDSIAYWNSINITEGIPTRFNDQTVDRATNYEYRVFAENALGNGTGTISNSVLTNDFPAIVTGLTAERPITTQIDLSWDELPDDSGVGFPSTGVNLTKYQIFRSENGGAFTLVGENLRQSPPAIIFNDTSVNALFFYSYEISACNELGCGGNSSSFFVAQPPDQPTNLNATAKIADVFLEWTGNATTDDDYRIERSLVGLLSIESLWLNFNFDDPASRYNTSPYTWRWGNDNRTQAGEFGGLCDLDLDCVRSKPTGSQDGFMAMNQNFGSVQFQNDAARIASTSSGAGLNGTGSDYDFFNSGDWSVNAWIHPEVNTASSPFTMYMLSTIDEIPTQDFNDRNGIKILIGPSGNNTDGNFDRFLVQALDDSIDDVFVMNETSPIGMYDNDSTFHMFTIVHKNGEYLKWYRDGVLLETDLGTPLLSGTSDFPAMMGGMWGTCYNFENVTNSKCVTLQSSTVQTHVDEWSVWKQAIDDATVTTLFGGGLGHNFTGNNVDGDDGSTSFEIIVPSLVAVNATAFTEREYLDETVELGTSYTYRVTALNNTIPSEPSEIASVFTNDIPEQVQNLQTEFSNPTQIDLQWDDLPFNSGIGNPSTGLNLTKYQVFRQNVTAVEPFVLATEIFATSPPLNFFNDTVSPGFPNVYSYQISGCNAVGCGPNSTAVISEVTVVPNPVLNMIATAVDKTVSLDWDDSAFALNYTVLRNLNIPTVTIFSDDFSGTDDWTDTGSNMGVNTISDEIDWNGKRDTTNHATAFDFTSISDMEWELRGKIHFDTITSGTVFEHVFIAVSDSNDSVASSTSQDHVSLFFSIATSGDTKAGINSGTDALDEVAQASFTDNLYVQGDDVWFKLQRTSDTNYGATLYSDAFITPLESISATDLTASTDGLQYVKVQNSATVGGTGAFDGTIDDIILEETSTIFQIIAQGVLTSDYIDTTVLTNANYSYSAWGVNDIGNGTTGFSNSVITNDLPTEPLNLTGAMGIVIPDLEDVFLDWDIELDNGTGNPSTGVPIIDYTIERKQGLGSFSFLANVSGGIFTYEDESVISGANYTWHVKGSNIVGMSSFSNTFSIITTPLMPPDTPTDLTATTLSGSEIQLDWLAAITGDPPTDYVLQERHVGFGGFSTIATIPAPTLTFTSTSLVSGDTYDYQLRADNGAGSSGYSNIATNTTFTVPSAPQNLVADTDSDTQISLDWDEPASTNGGITKYNIEQESPIGGGFSEIAEIVNTNTPEELFLDDLFNNNGTVWQYRQAKAGVGIAFSTCSISISLGDRVQCAWSDGGGSTGTVYIFKTFPRSFLNNTQIQVSLSETDSTAFSPHTIKSTDVSAETLNYLDRSREAEWPLLAPRNFAVDILDGSSPVGIVDSQTHAVLADTDAGQTFDMIIPAISSQWNPPANSNYSSIIIEFFDTNSLASTAKNNIFWINITDIDTGDQRAFYNFTGASRTVEAQDAGCTPKCSRGTITAGSSTFINSTGFELQSLNETNTQFTVTGLTTKTEYNFRVNAENVVGTSPYSNEAANTTFGVPDAPINLSGVSNGVSEITVTWDEGLSNFGSAVTGYRIDQAQGVGGTFVTTIANTGNNIEPLTETFIGLLQQTTYVYRIAAINGFGLGPFSANLTAGTFIGASSPENFFVIFNATRPYSTFMSWETPLTDGGQPIAGYLIERKDVGGSFQLIANLTSPLLLNFTDTNLLNLAQHEYRVAAYSNPTGDFTPGQQVATVVTPNFQSFTINEFTVVGDVLNQQYTVVIDDCFPACTLTQADIERNGIVESNYIVGEPIVLDSLLNFTTFFIIPTSGTQNINTTAIVTNLGTTGDEEVGVVTTSLEFVVDTIFFNHSRNTAFDKLNFELVRHPVPWNAECEIRGGRAAIVDTIIPVLPFGGTITLPGTIVVDPTAITATLSLQGVGSYESPPQFNVLPSRNAYMSCQDPIGTQILAFVSFGTGNGTLALTGFTNQLGTFLGVPVPFIFIIILAAIWTGRSASTGIIFLAVAIGAMGVLGYFDPLTGDPTQGETSLAYFWLFIVFLTLVGVFLGKRFF